jgi:long-chain fatty acid transport protein
MKSNSLRLFCLIALGLAAEHAALSQGFYNSGAGARSAALGGAYTASGDSALEAMAINPAGLTTLTARTLDLSFEGLFARGQFVNSANQNGRMENTAGLVPFGAFGTPLGKSRFSIGFAETPDLMTAAKWRYLDTPGGVGGVSYGLLNQQSAILAMRSSAGLGIYLGPKVSIGVTFGAVYNSNTLQTAYVFQNQPALAGLKTLLDLHTNGVGYNGSVGILTHPTKKLRIGVAYKTQTTIASRGDASGNIGIQLAKLGLGAARPDFQYNAEVDNVLPQSVIVNLIWSPTRRTKVVAQEDWIDWKRAFVDLPVKLTQGTNADINGVLGTNSISDSIPLQWRDQYVSRIGVERMVAENAVVRAGYVHANSPVPSSTLSPLTAVIMGNTLSTGFGYRHGRARFDAAYSLDLTAHRNVGQSVLKSGEYSNSRVSVGTQSVSLMTSIWF